MATDSIVNALRAMSPQTGGTQLKIVAEFGDKPEVLAAIVEARRRRCSFRQIAHALSCDGVTISAAAVSAYLTSVGMT